MTSLPVEPAAPSAPVLTARGVVKQFAGVRALDGVDLTLVPGEVHALVGENGAGKSTLIKVLTGVHQADAGEITLAGEPVRFSSPAAAQNAGISTIYQEVNLIPLQSVARNIAMGREPRRFGLIDFRRMNREAKEVLVEYGIDLDVTRPLRSLGLGLQQMVALARAVSVRAQVVIMDEPTSSLEPREVETLFGVISLLKERGVAVVYVSHRMDELYRICDAVTVMRDGKVVRTGRLTEIDRPHLVSAMLGRDLESVRREGTTTFDEGSEAHGEPVLRVKDLERRHALHGVSFDVRPGEIVGLGGLLGAGRSETAKAIVGAFPLDSGEVDVAGHRLRRRTTSGALHAGIVLLSEDRKTEGIVPTLSVRENIVLAALPQLSRAGLVSRAKQDAVVDLFMKRLRIKASSPEQKVGELSGGNQQKVLLARWLATGPKVLLLDEPTRGIDVGAKAEVQTLIGELAKEGLAVTLISSEIEELVEGSDRIVVLKDGAVVEVLTGDQVSEDHLMAALAVSGDDVAGVVVSQTAVRPPRADWQRLDLAWLSRNGVYLALVLVLVLNAFITPNFDTVDNLRTQLVQVVPVVIVALGMALVIGTEGVDLGVGSVMAIAAAVLPLYLGYGWAVGCLLAVLAGVATGLLSGSLVAFAGVQPIVATLAIFVGGRGLAIVIGGGTQKQIVDPSLLSFGTGDVVGIPYTVILAAVLALVIGALVRFTTFGRRVVAIGGNRVASGLAGLPVRRTLVTVYVICGVLAAIAGVVATARLTASTPNNLGKLMELSAITAVVVGGTPLTGGQVRILGTLAGALLMQLIRATLISHNLPDSTAQMVQAGIIVLAIYLQIVRKRA